MAKIAARKKLVEKAKLALAPMIAEFELDEIRFDWPGDETIAFIKRVGKRRLFCTLYITDELLGDQKALKAISRRAFIDEYFWLTSSTLEKLWRDLERKDRQIASLKTKIKIARRLKRNA